MNIRGLVLTTLVCAVAFGGGACGDASSLGAPDPNPVYGPNRVSVIGVRVTPQTLQFVAIGASEQLTATVAPIDATDQAVTWISSDTSVATVDATGRVTAHKAGDGVFITAYTRDGNYESSVNVQVIP